MRQDFKSMEEQLLWFRGQLPSMLTRDVRAYLKEYESYNSVMGCYDEIIEEIRNELINR